MVFCSKCGKSISEENYVYCPHCGNQSNTSHTPLEDEIVDSPIRKSKNNNVKKIAIVTGISIAVVIVIIMIAAIASYNANSTFSSIQILDVNFDREVGLFETNYVISGRVINSGNIATNPIVLQISISGENGERYMLPELHLNQVRSSQIRKHLLVSNSAKLM